MDNGRSFINTVRALGSTRLDIFLHLRVCDVDVLSIVCKYFRGVVWGGGDDSLWISLILRDLYLRQDVTINDENTCRNLMKVLGIEDASLFYHVFKSYRIFHADSSNLPSIKVNLFNFVGHWRSVPQGFSPQNFRGGLMNFVVDVSGTEPRLLLQFRNVYNIVYRTFWVHYLNDGLAAVSINSYDNERYSLSIHPNYSITQFDANEQINMPSVTIALSDPLFAYVYVLKQIYTGDAVPNKFVIPQRLYTASHGKYGLELLFIYHDVITGCTKALKIIGDETVPAGKLSFISDESPQTAAQNLALYDSRPTYASHIFKKETEVFYGGYMDNLPPCNDDHTVRYIQKNILVDHEDSILSHYLGHGNTNYKPFFWLNEWLPLKIVLYDPCKRREDKAMFSVIWEDTGYAQRRYMDFMKFDDSSNE